MRVDGMMVKPAVTAAVTARSAHPRPEQAAAPAVQSHAAPEQPPVDLEKVAHQLESFLKRVSRSLEFHVDDASGRVVCSVRHAETGDLIRQIPNEEVLRLAKLAHDEKSVLLNETA